MRYKQIIMERGGRKVIPIMAGRFHPPHKGHLAAYNWLKKRFGNAYIATSNKVEEGKSPFTFNEKEFLFKQFGISDNAIHMTIQPYSPKEITQHFNPQRDIVIFGVSKKDMADDPRFTFQPKKDGSPSYMQPFKQGKLAPFSQHGYVIEVPTFKFKILSKEYEAFQSSSEIRNSFPMLNRQEQRQFIEDLYGKYSKEIHQLFRQKLRKP